MKSIFSLFLLMTVQSLFAQLKISPLFSNHAVLQRQKPLPVWGKANPNEEITVNFAQKTQKTVTNTEGVWRVTFAAMEAGGPFDMTVSNTKDTLKVSDILMGEVWLCSGQSNMEWRVSNADNYLKERKNADFPQIRHFEVEHEVSLQPNTELASGAWKIASSETVGAFSAVGFFFARDIYKKLNIPMGILHSSWGGSQVESWISKEGMLSSEELKDYAQNLPTTWEDADMRLERSIKKKLFGDADKIITLEDEAQYLKPDYDFSKWWTTNPMGQWDWKGIWAWRGNGFMAKMIEIPSEMIGKITTLGLGECFSHNEIYINGKLISAGILRGSRKILVPKNTWKAGMNKLMIKMEKVIEPEWYGLGLGGNLDDLFVSNETQKIQLEGNEWKIMPSFAEPHTFVHSSNNVGTSIYNSMISPLIQFPIAGVLWYQGESNAGRAFQYRKTFPLLIQDWRKHWNDEFPFYFVQLATYGSDQNSNQGSNWAELREAQTMTLKLPKTGMAVTTDIGNPKDIHPTNKQDVGKRLAAIALKDAYNQPVVPSGPLYESVRFDNQKAVVSFKYAEKGLMIKDRYGYLKGFEIAGDDHVFYYTKGEIQGDKVVVFHPKGMKPTAVRYAWSDAPEEVNLFNTEGYPASPFRTDNWKGVTENIKFD
jgi:sialate O-acetylesterase